MDNLKSVSQIWEILASQYNVTSRSIETFNRRVKGEGSAFLYQTLTELGRAFDIALITGQPMVKNYRFTRSKLANYPVFLSELFSRVLDKDGVLRVDADAYVIKHIRQLLLLCYKIKVPYHELCVERYFKRFVDTDRAIELPSVPEGSYRKARALLGRVLAGLDPADIVPRHGPGATACRTPARDKYHTMRHVARLNEVYPYDEYFMASMSHVADCIDEIQEAEHVDEPEARLVAVPKDARGPRLICCEPSEHQYVQQGLMRLLYDRVERHHLTAGFVNFTDQTINQERAREASIDQMYATLDLKDASDRVQWAVVERLFPTNWVRAFDACRTRYVNVNGELYGPLRKFAPMGSAVCFPVQALVFWSLIRAHVKCDVWVYGDDIIVPLDCVKQTMDVLHAFGLVVNVEKSCYRTPFRESCGGDYFSGIDVSYVKIREEFNDTIVSHIASVEFVNQITKHYGELVGRSVADVVDGSYGPHYSSYTRAPLAYYGSPRALNDVFFKRRWNRDLQRWEYLLPTVVTSDTRHSMDTPHEVWCELLRWQCAGGGEHHRAGVYKVPDTLTMKFRWRSDYSD